MSQVVWPLPSMVDVVMPTIEQALANHKRLTDKMLALATVPSGKYALFSHNARVSTRITDIQLFFTRLTENRKLVTELNKKNPAFRQEISEFTPRLEFTPQLQEVVQQTLGVLHQMRLDMESLFIFGNLLLEQWTYVILYATGKKVTREDDFTKFMTRLQAMEDKGLLEPMWDNHHKDMLWLLYQIRNYRNIFIEHARDPYPQITSMFIFGDNFRLGNPASDDWVTQDEIERLVKKIRYLAPQWAKLPARDEYTKDPRQLLEIIFFYIDEIKEHHRREEVWNVWKTVGGETFSYDVIAFRLMRFIAGSMLTMLDVITNHPEKINEGATQTNQP